MSKQNNCYQPLRDHKDSYFPAEIANDENLGNKNIKIPEPISDSEDIYEIPLSQKFILWSPLAFHNLTNTSINLTGYNEEIIKEYIKVCGL